jgi:hypothetical protein
MAQDNYHFDKTGFLQAFGNELRTFLNRPDLGKDPHTGILPYHSFTCIIRNFQYKFEAIGKLTGKGPFSEAFWKAFFAIYVVPIRKELYPNIQAKIETFRTHAY